MRFAGIAKQYSTPAKSQLIRMTLTIGFSVKRKCQYHAAVMKTFDMTSKRMGMTAAGDSMESPQSDSHRKNTEEPCRQVHEIAIIPRFSAGRLRGTIWRPLLFAAIMGPLEHL